MLLKERLPGRDDAGGIAPDRRHVREPHAIPIGAERRAQHAALRGIDDDQDRLLPFDTLADERGDALDEVVPPLIEKCRVPEGTVYGSAKVLTVVTTTLGFSRLERSVILGSRPMSRDPRR